LTYTEELLLSVISNQNGLSVPLQNEQRT